MQILNEIIEEAVDNKSPVSGVLRKCLVLAYKLKNASLQTWVEKELNGYERGDPLPDYRLATTISRGHFLGGFGASISNQPLPSSILQAEHRHFCSEAKFQQAIAVYEAIDGNGQIPWPPELTVLYQSSFFEGYALNRAWQEVPLSMVTGLVDNVRNKILKFALEIQVDLGSVDDNPERLSQTKVQTLVTNYIYGGNVNFGNNIGSVSQTGNSTVTMGNFQSLSDELQKMGVRAGEVTELMTVMAEDGASTANPAPGEKTKGWISKTASALGDGALSAGAAVIKEGLTGLVNAYLGIG